MMGEDAMSMREYILPGISRGRKMRVVDGETRGRVEGVYRINDVQFFWFMAWDQDASSIVHHIRDDEILLRKFRIIVCLEGVVSGHSANLLPVSSLRVTLATATSTKLI